MKILIALSFVATLLLPMGVHGESVAVLPNANIDFQVHEQTVGSENDLEKIVLENKKKYTVSFQNINSIGQTNGKIGLITAVVYTGINSVAWSYAFRGQPDLFLMAVGLSALVNYTFTYKTYYLKILDHATVFAEKISGELNLKLRSRKLARFSAQFSTAVIVSTALTIIFKTIHGYSDGEAIFNDHSFWRGVRETVAYSLMSNQIWNLNLIEWKSKFPRLFSPQMVSKIYIGLGLQSAAIGPALIYGNQTAQSFAMASFTAALVAYFSTDKFQKSWSFAPPFKERSKIGKTRAFTCAALFAI